jgi:hypothetical protein
MEKTVMLVWSAAATLAVCGMTVGMKQAPSRSDPRAETIEVDRASPAYTETNCACGGFDCGGVSYPPCNAVCRDPKHASCSQGTCSGPYGFETATPNQCRCEER